MVCEILLFSLQFWNETNQRRLIKCWQAVLARQWYWWYASNAWFESSVFRFCYGFSACIKCCRSIETRIIVVADGMKKKTEEKRIKIINIIRATAVIVVVSTFLIGNWRWFKEYDFRGTSSILETEPAWTFTLIKWKKRKALRKWFHFREKVLAIIKEKRSSFFL